MPPKTWNFIPTYGSSKDEDNQRIIRQTAMRDYRRTERLARVREYMEVQAEKSQHHAGTSERQGSEQDQEISALEYSDLSRETTPAPGPGFGFIDPFDSTVLPRRKDAWILFSHCECDPYVSPFCKRLWFASVRKGGRRLKRCK